MSQSDPKNLSAKRRRRRWGRIARDVLLLPPALLYVIIEQVFWRGAKRLLRQASHIPAIAALQARLETLPAAAILPLFLVPEILSHIGGFWASALLVQRHFLSALMVGLFVKGTATVIVVWIYQSCEAKLLTVTWFARSHHKFMQARDWVVERTGPARRFARWIIAGSRGGLTRRFSALRNLLARRIGSGP
jgi:hypothetical protein